MALLLGALVTGKPAHPGWVSLLAVPWLAAVSLTRRSKDEGRPHLPAGQEAGFLLLVAGLLAPLFFLGLENYPYEITVDSGINGNLAIQAMMDDPIPAVSTEYVHEPSLPFKLQGLSLRHLGVSVASLRLPTAFMAWMGGLGIYCLGRLFVGPWGALAAALIFAVTPVQFAYSRTAETTGMVPPLQAWSLFFALLAFQRRQPAWLFPAGFLAGFGCHTYLAFLAYLIGSIVWVSFECHHPSGTPDVGPRGTLLFFLGLVPWLLPLLPEASRLAGTLAWVAGEAAPGSSGEGAIGRVLLLHPMVQCLAGKTDLLAGRQEFPPPLFLLALAGMTWLSIRQDLETSTRRGLWMLALLGPAPILFSGREPLATRRFILFVLPMALCAGAALECLVSKARENFPGLPPAWPRACAVGLILYLVGASLATNHMSQAEHPSRHVIDSFLRVCRGEPRVLHGVFGSALGHVPDLRTRFLLHRHSLPLLDLAPALGPTDDRALDLLAPDSPTLFQTLMSLFPNVEIQSIPEPMDRYGPHTIAASIPARDLVALQGLRYTERPQGSTRLTIPPPSVIVPSLEPPRGGLEGPAVRTWQGYVLVRRGGPHATRLTQSGDGRLSLTLRDERFSTVGSVLEIHRFLSVGFHRVEVTQAVPGASQPGPCLRLENLNSPVDPEDRPARGNLYWQDCPPVLRGTGLAADSTPLWIRELDFPPMDEVPPLRVLGLRSRRAVAFTGDRHLLLAPMSGNDDRATPVWQDLGQLRLGGKPLPSELAPRADLAIGERPWVVLTDPEERQAYLIELQDSSFELQALQPLTPFEDPGPVAIEPSTGRIWIGDRRSGCIAVFSAGGDPLTSLSRGAIVDLEPAEEEGVFVLTAGPGTIRLFSAGGEERARWTWPGITHHDQLKTLPGGLLALIQIDSERVVVFDAEGRLKSIPEPLFEDRDDDEEPLLIAAHAWGPRGVVLMRDEGGVDRMLEILYPTDRGRR